jgi:hypothetical protein
MNLNKYKKLISDKEITVTLSEEMYENCFLELMTS